MNTNDVVEKVAEDAGMNKTDAKELISLVLDTCTTSAIEDGSCRFARHRFVRKERSAYTGRNPQTGEPIQIPAKTYVKYQPIGG